MSDLPRDAYATYIRTRTEYARRLYRPGLWPGVIVTSRYSIETASFHWHLVSYTELSRCFALFAARRPSRFRHTEHRPPSFTARWSSTVTHNVERLRQLLMSNTATADGPRDKMCQSTVLQQL